MKCVLCNKRIWPWQLATVDHQHRACYQAMMVGFELGRRRQLEIVKAFVTGDDDGNALKVRRLRNYIKVKETGSAGGDAA